MGHENLTAGGSDALEIEELVAQSPLPEGIEEYAGKWVAIRGGEGVVIAAESFDDVVESEQYESTDAVYHVPEPGYKYYPIGSET